MDLENPQGNHCFFSREEKKYTVLLPACQHQSPETGKIIPAGFSEKLFI
jgi:hypothetical protein